MIEMPNSQMIPNNQESSSNMDISVMITTTVMSTTQSANTTMPEDMVFNPGHQLSIIVYSILMFISAIGNISVLVLLVKRRMRTPSRLDIMLTHLAIADLMVTFLLMPLEISWAYTVEWIAGDAMCRIMMFFRTFGLYLSSFILVCISLDRYYAVLKPLNLKEHRGKIMIATAWILSAFCSAPQSFIFHVDTHPVFTNFTQCVSFHVLSPSGEVAYNVICMLMMYAVPLIIIIFSYASIYYEIFQKSRMKNSDRFRRSSINVLGRAKRRTLRMTITIVIVFVVCWTPYYVMVVWHFVDQEEAKKASVILQKSLYLFACTNSCMNPIVYGIFNLKRNKTDRNTKKDKIIIEVMDKGRDGNEIEALLLDTIRKRMTDSGQMNKIESEMRAMVLNDLQGGSSNKSPLSSLSAKNDKSPMKLANHLVLEYLEWMNFQYAKEMLEKESGMGNASSRDFIESQVGDENAKLDKDLPLLLTLAMKLTKK